MSTRSPIEFPSSLLAFPPLAQVDDRNWCTLARPTSRRFYVHVRSFGYLLNAQPLFMEDLGWAIALSAASRAAEQVAEDRVLFDDDAVNPRLLGEVKGLHKDAASALQGAFQDLVQLVPPRYGATEFLLDAHETIDAWCYEDGYFTYATDADAAKVMYAETGSLRELRSKIRRTPEYDESLQMISGPSLFYKDRQLGVGSKKARGYREQHARLVRREAAAAAQLTYSMARVEALLTARFLTFDAENPTLDLVSRCLLRATKTINMVLQARPT